MDLRQPQELMLPLKDRILRWARGIHSRLVLLALLCMAPITLLVLYSAYETHRLTSIKAVETLATQAAHIRSDLNSASQTATQLLTALSLDPQHLLTQEDKCEDLLAGLMANFSGYASLFSTDGNGRVICSADGQQAGTDLSSRAYLRRALQGEIPRPGTPIFGAMTGRAVLPLAAPLRDAEGRVIGAVGAGIALNHFLESHVRGEASAAVTAIGNETTMTLWDAQGRVLARFPDPEGLVGNSGDESNLYQGIIRKNSVRGTLTSEGLDGTPRHYAYNRMGHGDDALLITVGLPSANLLADIEEVFRNTLVTLVLVFLTGLAAAWWLGELVVRRPVTRLANVARQVSDGDLQVRTGDIRGARELQTLAQGFDDMLINLERYQAEREQAREALEHSRDDLEDRIQERTRQLEQLSQEATERAVRLEEQGREVSILNELTDLLQSCHTLEETRPIIARSLQELFSSTHGNVYLFRESGNALEISTGWGEEAVQSVDSFAPDDCWSLRLGRTWDYAPEGRAPACHHIQDNEPAPYFCAPMLAEGKTLGVLHITGNGGLSTEQGRHLAETTAARLGLALSNIKLREALRNLSIRDALTGLYNRRFVEDIFEHEIMRCQRNELPLSVLMLDIDHFKRFNDTHGHEAGDVVLRAVGNLLQREFRSSDLPCRMGGEEFLIILPEAEADMALERAEDLRRGIEAVALFHNGEGLGSVTASIGIATWPKPIGDHTGLIEAADVALYQAKNSGRNRSCVAGQDKQA